ncbi:MAG: 16S rRNA (guanine(966)-N(2))-methyltransferase RsmD [bacterium]
MRIITGSAKGKKLKAPRGYKTRPTSDKVKEALFDILGERVIGSKFLDLYAGTGSIGIEVLSRGAWKATFVEDTSSLINLIWENLKSCDFVNNAEVIQADVKKSISSFANRQHKFDIIYIDPPYNSTLAEETLEVLAKSSILSDNHYIIVEHNNKKILPENFWGIVYQKQYEFGDTRLTFYTKK